MKCLINNYPHIVSRQEIYETVWCENEMDIEIFQKRSENEKENILKNTVTNTIAKISPSKKNSIMNDCLQSFGRAYRILLVESPFTDYKNVDNLNIENNININIVNNYDISIQWKEAWKLKKEGDKFFHELVEQMNLRSSKEKRTFFDLSKAKQLRIKAISAYEEFLSYSLLANSDSPEVGNVYRNLANCYIYANEKEKATEFLLLAAKRYWNVTAMQNLAFFHKMWGNFAEAEKWYRIAAALGDRASAIQLSAWMEERKNKQK